MRLLNFLGAMMLILTAYNPIHTARALEKTGAKYVVNLLTDKQTIEVGKPFTLTLTIMSAADRMPVMAFDEVHTKLMHLIVVSKDMHQFLHLHPEYLGNGVFELQNLTLPQIDEYVVFADFTPTGDSQQVIRNVLSVTDAVPGHAHLQASPQSITSGGLTIQLDNDSITTGSETTLSFHITDTTTGEDIDQLDEYLGAAGHLVIIDPTTEVYIHTHPADHAKTETADSHNTHGMSAQYGPHLEFIAAFPREGLWAMWLQVLYRDEVYTFPYVIEVTAAANTTPSAPAHSHG